MCRKWPDATAKLVEDKANGTAVIDSLKKEIAGIVPVNPRDSKYSRASGVSPFIEAGNVFLPAPQVALFAGVDSLIDEAAAFPNGTHDDQVDATSQALDRLLLRGGAGATFLDAMKKRAEAEGLEVKTTARGWRTVLDKQKVSS
jgi:predicted phage terminase large subunit-like protein